MKEALADVAGSNFPVTLTTADGETKVAYLRGFADSNKNVALLSETSYSLALQILEVQDIATLTYTSQPNGETERFRARWLAKRANV